MSDKAFVIDLTGCLSGQTEQYTQVLATDSLNLPEMSFRSCDQPEEPVRKDLWRPNCPDEAQ